MLLAGDVGGTKTNLAIYTHQDTLPSSLMEATLPSSDYPSLETLVRDFLSRTNIRVDHASFGIPGPVVEGRATVTNLPWVVDAARLERELGLSSVRLLNDLAATAHAIPHLATDDLHTLNAGNAVPGGAIAVIAPGTGLGEAFLTWDGNRYQAHGTEGGHTSFGPTTALEMGLLSYLRERYEYVSYERVCSGIGMPNIYAYLRDSGYAEEPGWLREELATADDHTPIIATVALDSERSCDLCTQTLEIFTSILGAEAGNLALKILATGGVYLGGGIPPRILPALESGIFMTAFCTKGRFSDLMARIPVRVILNPKAALLGAACFGLEM